MTREKLAMDPLARNILRHYDATRRDLPWRRAARASDPYAVWVSEVMLQQTRVETIAPRFEPFLDRFPTLERLARAPEGDVLAEWSGLGYYARGRNLHAAAREIVARYGGEVPREPAALADLPGVGRYTAGAVASIAYGVRAPVVDGNVARVLCRLRGIEGDPRTPAVQRALWALAESIVPADRPGDFNQALMELGATICTPRAPRCPLCPWRRDCVARKTGRTGSLPTRVAKKSVPRVRAVAVVVVRAGRVLLARRPTEGLLGGTWEPPSDALRPSESIAACARRVARAHGLRIGGRIWPAGTVRHLFSHRDLRLTVVRAALASRPPRPRGDLRFVPLASLDARRLALSTLARRVLAAAQIEGT